MSVECVGYTLNGICARVSIKQREIISRFIIALYEDEYEDEGIFYTLPLQRMYTMYAQFNIEEREKTVREYTITLSENKDTFEIKIKDVQPQSSECCYNVYDLSPEYLINLLSKFFKPSKSYDNVERNVDIVTTIDKIYEIFRENYKEFKSGFVDGNEIKYVLKDSKFSKLLELLKLKKSSVKPIYKNQKSCSDTIISFFLHFGSFYSAFLATANLYKELGSTSLAFFPLFYAFWYLVLKTIHYWLFERKCRKEIDLKYLSSLFERFPDRIEIRGNATELKEISLIYKKERIDHVIT